MAYKHAGHVSDIKQNKNTSCPHSYAELRWPFRLSGDGSVVTTASYSHSCFSDVTLMAVPHQYTEIVRLLDTRFDHLMRDQKGLYRKASEGNAEKDRKTCM
jgi:hypothetical protein